ncbi:hypothetical protein OAA76_03890 [Planktotalea frisia]|nr:hypothetical protein [Planktotalea frisia]
MGQFSVTIYGATGSVLSDIQQPKQGESQSESFGNPGDSGFARNALGTITGAFMSAGALAPAIDLMALVVVVAVGVGHVFGAKDGENRITRFGDGCVRGGWLGLLIGVIVILNVNAEAQMDFTMIIPAMAVAWLTPLYGYFFKLISMQLD